VVKGLFEAIGFRTSRISKRRSMKYLQSLRVKTRRLLSLCLRVKSADPLFNTNEELPSLEVFIPVVNKDFPTLPWVIESVLNYSRNPINKIFIITPNPEVLYELSKIPEVQILHESSFLDLDLFTIKAIYPEHYGWYLQQLIKLKSVSFSNSQYILWMDADTVLNEYITFVSKGIVLERISDEFHLPYFVGLSKVFGFQVPKFRFSRVAHHAIVVKEAFLAFQVNHKIQSEKDWLEVMKRTQDLQSKELGISDWHIFGKSSFSEYELNSLILAQYHIPRKKAYWWNESRNHLNFDNLGFISHERGLFEKISKKLRPKRPFSVSFHSWSRKIIP